MRLLFLLVILSVSFSFLSLKAEPGQGKVIFRLNLKESEMRIQELPGSIDIAGQDIQSGTVDIVGSQEYFELLKSDGYPVEVVQIQPEKIDSRYMTPQKIGVLVREISEQYPDLVHIEVIGKSLRGLPIYGLRISTKENLESKPAVLFNAMHHAREIMTPEVAIDIMLYLVKNFENAETPWVAEWLSQLSIWIIPQVNPDGNQIVWSEDNWWRKNARGDDDRIWGVDINRNYPYAWGKCNGSSPIRGNDTYRGEKAGSEPETQAIMNFVRSHNIVLSISYHSYSELVIAPYGCRGSYAAENAIVKSIGLEFAKLLKTDNRQKSYKYGTGWELLYPVDGDDISWMYNELNTMAYVVEVNASSQGFQPDYDQWRNRTVEAQRVGWQYLLNRVLKGPQVRGRMIDAKTGQPVNGSIKIAGVKYTNEKPRMAKNGVYQKLIIPGSYELTFSAPGYASQTLAVSIDDGVIAQDIAFEPSMELFEQESVESNILN